MTDLHTWREQLPAMLADFAPLAREDSSIDKIFGITASAVLWPVREAPFDPDQQAALKAAAGDAHLPPLLRAITADGLTKAAQNLLKVAPIAAKIAQTLLKIG